jgi:hypothetical protein
MLLDQLSAFLRSYTQDDFSLRAREAILEWALSQEAGEDLAAAAADALSSLPAASVSPAMQEFRRHLEVASRGLPAPRRRGGSAGRRAMALQAA